MSCLKIRNMFYEEDTLPIISQIQIGLHTIFCPDCAQEIENYRDARSALKEDLLPISADWPDYDSQSDLEESIMARLNIEQDDEEYQTEGSYVTPAPLSTRRWVIAGIVLIVSLVTAFLGMDFKNLANESGMSFMLPMGITIGIILTTYGALFIGSHLKELSERFGL